jgi:hypothetical protein
MRFDEKTDFAHSIAQLTGLKPLEDLGKRAQRIVTRLRGPEVRTTEQNRTQRVSAFETKRRALVDAWQAQPDLRRRLLRHRAKRWTAGKVESASRPLEPVFRRHNVS